MIAAALAGDAETALELDTPLSGLHRDLFLQANPIPVKWALEEMGRIPPGIRLPLVRLAAEHQAAVRRSLSQAGVL